MEEFTFRKFQKVYESLQQYKCEAKGIRETLKDTKWGVEEKIHGSNFSFYYTHNHHQGDNEEKIKYAKRSGFLDFDNDWFFGYQANLHHHCLTNARPLFIGLNELVRSRDMIGNQRVGEGKRDGRDRGGGRGDVGGDTHLTMVVYGEIFGGFFPSTPQEIKNPIKSRSKDIVPVQEGIYYSNDISFVVFDIAYYTSTSSELRFLGLDEREKLSALTSFRFSKPLFIANDLSEATDFNLEFTSPLAAQINPDTARQFTSNISEGVVIRPTNGAVSLGVEDGIPVRPLIKKKHPKFAEVAEIDNFDKSYVAKIKKTFLFIFPLMVNKNRLSSVLSKNLGILTVDNKNQAVKEMVEDVWSDFYTQGHFVDNEEIADQYLKNLCQMLIEREIQLIC
eukprot:GHVN01096983.1.p1 GENE.GHVN01096983.1~~GHVN01096983.1.p1  ORF type:complete len:392 (-),score=92.53 GHVN01096983.1:220-1395(-)